MVLEKYYRLDPQLAIDSVCDNSGDKGVDGIYINEGMSTIDIFQTKIAQSEKKSIGDTILKEFLGTLDQFSTKEKLENLIKTAGKAQVASLIQRLDLIEKLDAYSIRGVFISNVDLSSDGEAILNEIDDIEFLGKSELEDQYISDKKEINVRAEAEFDISENETTTYFADAETITYIAPIKAKELVQILNEALIEKIEDIENKLIARYALTKYALMYITRGILENDSVGQKLIQAPEEYVKTEKIRKALKEALLVIIDDVIIDLNAEVGDLAEDFDYKSSLRNDEWVKKLSRNIVSNYLKQIKRKRIPSFEDELNKAVANNG